MPLESYTVLSCLCAAVWIRSWEATHRYWCRASLLRKLKLSKLSQQTIQKHPKKDPNNCSWGCSSAAPGISVYSYKSGIVSLLFRSGDLVCIQNPLSLCSHPTRVYSPECRTLPRLVSGSCSAVICSSCPAFSGEVRDLEHPEAGKILSGMGFPQLASQHN